MDFWPLFLMELCVEGEKLAGLPATGSKRERDSNQQIEGVDCGDALRPLSGKHRPASGQQAKRRASRQSKPSTTVASEDGTLVEYPWIGLTGAFRVGQVRHINTSLSSSLIAHRFGDLTNCGSLPSMVHCLQVQRENPSSESSGRIRAQRRRQVRTSSTAGPWTTLESKSFPINGNPGGLLEFIGEE